MIRQFYTIVTIFVFASPVLAGDLKTYRCNYDRFADGEKIQKVENPFELVFVADSKGKVTMVGNQGSTEVTGIWNKEWEGVSFIEVTSVGNVMITVIDSKGRSIHSRHTIIRGEVVPSQYYGSCKTQ